MCIFTITSITATAIILIVLVTQLWVRSISTAIHAISVAAAIYSLPIHNVYVVMGILASGTIINMARAVLNTEEDRVIKRNNTYPLT